MVLLVKAYGTPMAEFRRGDGGIGGGGTEERWSGPDESSATGGDICLCANQDLFPSSCSEVRQSYTAGQGHVRTAYLAIQAV
jgi:hypothetical protein